MNRVLDHKWDLDKKEVIALQKTLAGGVIREDSFERLKYIVGVDVAYRNRDDIVSAAAVVLDVDTLDIIETKTINDIAKFPYIPGLFSLRELPPIINALEQLTITPDLLVCDGNGIAHPRRFGIACHLGILFDIPAIGCAKTRLTGEHSQVGPIRGDFVPLIDRDEVIGSVLRTQNEIDPVYVSPGHRVSLETTRKLILKLSPRYRLPETTRLSDRYARRALAEI
ncbi:MAG: deoxyribonuclease V [Clostridiales bacterium]|nr:deoxyribonuclease V [Clostridiales bacterium]